MNPLLHWLPPFVVGIAFALNAAPALPGGWLLPMVGWALLWLLHRIRLPYRHRYLFGCIGWAVLFLFGWQMTVSTDRRAVARPYLSSEGFFRATVLEPPRPSVSGKSHRTLVRLSAGLVGDTALIHGEALAMIWLAADSSRPLPMVGDRLWLRTQLLPPDGPRNPGEFDYRRYLALRHMHLRAFVRTGAWSVVGHESPHPLRALALRLRERFGRVLHEHVPAPREEAVAAALIFGEKQAIDDELERAYSDTGAMHLLAVSGMHVGLLATLLGALLQPMRRWRHGTWTQALILLAVVWLFALVTGLSGSVLRAAATFSLLQAGSLLRREGEPLNLLAGSAFVLLSYEPRVLLDVGAQLSYAAVAGILLFYRPLLDRWTPRPRILWAAWQLTAVSMAAQLGTLPLALWYFHQFPTYFLPSGWIGVPLSTVALPVGLALFALAEVPYLADVLGWLLYACVWLMNEGMALLARLPGATVPAGIGMGEVAALYLGLAALGFWAGGRPRKWLWAAMACLLLAAGIRAARLIPLGHRQTQVVFALREGNAALFVQGHRAVCRLDSAAAGSHSFRQCLRAFRGQNGIWSVEEFDWRDTSEHLAPGYWSWGPFVLVDGRRWGFFDAGTTPFDLVPPLDRWAVEGLGPREPPARGPEGEIIFLPSFSRKKISKWQSALPNVWDSKTQGAWIEKR